MKHSSGNEKVTALHTGLESIVTSIVTQYLTIVFVPSTLNKKTKDGTENHRAFPMKTGILLYIVNQ